jgi:hypothetical protein
MTYNVLQFRETTRQEPDDLDTVLRMIESISYPDLRCYMVDQIITAQNVEELAAAVELVSVVVAKRG